MNRMLVSLALGCLSSLSSAQIEFTIDVGTVGAPGSAVSASPDIAAIYAASLGSNTPGAPAVQLGLVPGDNIDAFDRGGVTSIVSGVSAYPFLFSVEPGAVGQMPYPVWGQAPLNAADVYAIESSVTGHVLAYDEPVLGLASQPMESIDGMTDPVPIFGQRVYFSLEQGSPTLLANAWSGADILTVVVGSPGTLTRAARASDLGLIPPDDIDGLALFAPTDTDGNGVFDSPGDSALVYFSVDELSVGEIGTDLRARTLGSAHFMSDIYMSGLVGTHGLLHEGDRRLRLGAGDDLDALKLGEQSSNSMFPMYRTQLPDPSDEPMKPANCPPYRGTGVPIGTIWVEVCDAEVPNIVNWSIEVKMCDANGNTMVVRRDGRVRGMASADPRVKAQLIKDAFESMMFDKPGQDPDSIPLFKGMSISIPPINVPRPGITGEVCMFVNQEVVDCGWNVDAICFSFSNWTAGIVVKPVQGWFPDSKRRLSLMVQGIAENDGLVRVSATDTEGQGGDDVAFAVPVAAGQDGLFATLELTNLINDAGGFAVFSPDGEMMIRELPIEPAPNSDGVSGPLVYEAGALGVAGLQITVGASLARGPESPCSPVDYAPPFGEVNFFDVSAFIAAFSDQSGQADLQFDGEFNFFDVSVFLQLYAQGCPKEDPGG